MNKMELKILCVYNFYRTKEISMADPQEAAALRVFSMSVLWNICQQVPELTEELILFNSVGVRVSKTIS